MWSILPFAVFFRFCQRIEEEVTHIHKNTQRFHNVFRRLADRPYGSLTKMAVGVMWFLSVDVALYRRRSRVPHPCSAMEAPH